MTGSPSALSYRTLAAVCFAAIAIAVAACSGGSGTIPSSGQASPSGQQPRGTAKQRQYTFSFQTVDYTQGGSDTRITGMDQRPDMIVGHNGTSPDSYSSWVAHTPYPSGTGFRDFRSRDYPSAGGTDMAAIANGYIQAGTVFSPPPNSALNCTECGVIYNSQGYGTGYDNPQCGSDPCMWTFVQNPNEGTGTCASTQLMGMAYYNLVVGAYKTGASSCGTQAFESYFNGSGQYFADFSVPNADPNSTRATGMNEEGNVVGTATFDGDPKGWFYEDANYCIGLNAPQATATYPLAVNWQNEIVGYYVDAKQLTHGFILINPAAAASNQVWQTVDEPNSSGYTVVSDITTHHYITGWYADTSGHDHGFVGTCTNCALPDLKGRARDAGERPATKTPHCTVGKDLVWKRR